ncbi:MAG: PmoA family protein [bacterium]
MVQKSYRMVTRFLMTMLIVGGGLSSAGYAVGEKAELTISAGPKARDLCPVTVPVPADSVLHALAVSGKPLRAVSEEETAPLAVLPAGTGVELALIVNHLDAWENRVYQILEGEAAASHPVQLESLEGRVVVTIGEAPFTTYDYTTNPKKPWPIFYPLFGPQGVRMTRGFPMEKFDKESEDHPHHQSMWVAHGSINGIDLWSIGENHGYTQQKEITTTATPVAGRITAKNDWTDKDGKKLLEEQRVITIWGTPDTARMVDFDMTFKATEGDVKFGDTKEGGLVSLRVATSLQETQGPGQYEKGGVIINANGQTGTKEAWGKAAPWCDYSGPVGNLTGGLTIMDHPQNPFYPTHYHVRDYGLFTANPFGLSDFIDKSQDGSRILKNGETWHLRYRVFIHAGDLKEARVAEKYANFAEAPKTVLR